MTLRTIAALALAALLVAPSIAADDDAKGKKKKNARGNAAGQLIKQLEPVGLTEDQIAKIKELGKASTTAMAQVKKDAGITAELMKKRQAAMKELKDSGKKGKELAAAINAKAGISEAQAEALVKANTSRQKLQRDVMAILTDEQKAKLPEKMQRFLKAGKKGGAKKKKKAE